MSVWIDVIISPTLDRRANGRIREHWFTVPAAPGWQSSEVSETRAVETIIETLGLEPHPEGGWYREAFRDDASSAIWFLLRSGERSHWHRVHGSAEVWHHYAGDPLRLSVAGEGDVTRTLVLGVDLTAGDRPQIVVPAGAWQAAEPIDDGARGYTLVGCTVAPPFRFEAFELAPKGWSP
jgi:hypothetical protein